MLDMHGDMAGSAVALGILAALTETGYPHPVDAWLALAENRIGPDSYTQQDVVTAANGTTIQVMHTDAEGRMVLADTLALASRTRPASSARGTSARACRCSPRTRADCSGARSTA